MQKKRFRVSFVLLVCYDSVTVEWKQGPGGLFVTSL